MKRIKLFEAFSNSDQIDLIDAIISSQSTPLIPEIERAFEAGQHSHQLGYNY